MLRSSSLPQLQGESDRQAIARDLSSLIEGEVRFGPHDRMLYATDASIYQLEPIGVVIPHTRADVIAVVEYCATRGLPVLPRGGGTSLAGQCVNAAVVIDAAPRLNRIIEIDPSARIAVVEPGVVLDQLNTAAALHGLMFGPDVATASHANLGGMIGNNSAGARSLRYGRTVDHLRALEVALADGRQARLAEGGSISAGPVAALTGAVAGIVQPLADVIDARFPKTKRRVNGYNLDLILDQLRRSTPGTHDRVNLAHLLCGSEGTLAVTLSAELDLVPRPARTALAVASFSGIDQALQELSFILGTDPVAVELIDEMVLERALANSQTRRFVSLLPMVDGHIPGAVLYIEYAAEGDEPLEQRRRTLERWRGDHLAFLTDAAAMDQAWALRKAGEPLLHGTPGPRKPVTFVEDLAVDPKQLPQFVAEFRQLLERFGTTAAYYAHASVGCLHIRPLIDIHQPAERGKMESIAEAATDLVKRYHGALSGEHGDGRLRSHLLQRFYGPEICDGFARIKRVFDPDGRMNPGVIVDPPPMMQDLRVMPGRRPCPREEENPVPKLETFYRYGAEGGFEQAVHLCNGAGVCRRMKGGAMCPSYRATRDERHATRGRGNALRLAITGQLGPSFGVPAFNDEQTLATLDLCLSCKACKSECPSNVDLAKLKAEYTAHSYAAAGRVPLAARAMGHVRSINRLGSTLWPVANPAAGCRPARWAMERLLRIDRRRSLPPYRASLHRWFTRNADPPADGPVVVLLADCFTTYNEPEVGAAAISVLQRLGYRVVLPDVGCCGRAMISNGMLGAARHTISDAAGRLRQAVDRHGANAVVGCEPSCVSAITDDWTDLKLDAQPADVAALAGITSTVEQFIEAHWDAHRWPLAVGDPADRPGSPVLYHGHCHERALWGIERPAALLRRFLGDRLTVLDAGCCGMAGGFGYVTDHYDLSLRIGGLQLFPAIEEHPEAALLASGTSCRHQIRDGTGRRPRHPVEHIADWL